MSISVFFVGRVDKPHTARKENTHNTNKIKNKKNARAAEVIFRTASLHLAVATPAVSHGLLPGRRRRLGEAAIPLKNSKRTACYGVLVACVRVSVCEEHILSPFLYVRTEGARSAISVAPTMLH